MISHFPDPALHLVPPFFRYREGLGVEGARVPGQSFFDHLVNIPALAFPFAEPPEALERDRRLFPELPERINGIRIFDGHMMRLPDAVAAPAARRAAAGIGDEPRRRDLTDKARVFERGGVNVHEFLERGARIIPDAVSLAPRSGDGDVHHIKGRVAVEPPGELGDGFAEEAEISRIRRRVLHPHAVRSLRARHKLFQPRRHVVPRPRAVRHKAQHDRLFLFFRPSKDVFYDCEVVFPALRFNVLPRQTDVRHGSRRVKALIIPAPADLIADGIALRRLGLDHFFCRVDDQIVKERVVPEHLITCKADKRVVYGLVRTFKNSFFVGYSFHDASSPGRLPRTTRQPLF